MREVNSQILQDKIDEAVTHYISSHQQSAQSVHVDANSLALGLPEDTANRVVTVMQNYSPQLCRQVPITEHVGEGGQWSEELLDPDIRIAALVAHLAQNSRSNHHVTPTHHKQVPSVRGEVDSNVILDSSMRLYNGSALEHQSEPPVVQVPHLPPLPPLQDMKRCQDSWYEGKDKAAMKESPILPTEMELACSSPAQNKQSKKSLPHKKRISRKLKRNTGSSTPQQDIVVISCSSGAPSEQILPDSFAAPAQLPPPQHVAHEMRPILICQICGEFHGEDQLKFYHHLKQHYEPHATIIIENPVNDLGIDKMTNTCIVDNVPTLPDSIVELSLENTVPKTLYQPIDKHVYADKSIYNKIQYAIDKESDKAELYEDTYSCGRCYKSFRKQKQCETHIKEVHGNSKLEYMGEFSDPEDLMEGIHVCVDGEGYLPQLVVDNGHVTQDHHKHWYYRNSGQITCGPDCTYCPPQPHLKEEALQRIFDSEVNDNANFPENMMHDSEISNNTHTHHTTHPNDHTNQSKQPTNHNTNQNNEAASHPSDHTINHDHADTTDSLSQSESNGTVQLQNTQNNDSNSQTNKLQIEEKQNEIKVKKKDERLQPIIAYTESRNKKGDKKNKRYDCQQCGKIFYHRNSLMYHVLSHGRREQECNECGKAFFTLNALKIHQRQHSGNKPYKCDECGRDFRQWSVLMYHKNSIHSNQKNFKCEYCNKEFARKYSLRIHVRIHTGEKNYKCDYCNKSFTASSYRLSHMRTHTGEKPYKCSICEKSFRVSSGLRRHMVAHEKFNKKYLFKEEKEANVKLEGKA